MISREGSLRLARRHGRRRPCRPCRRRRCRRRPRPPGRPKGRTRGRASTLPVTSCCGLAPWRAGRPNCGSCVGAARPSPSSPGPLSRRRLPRAFLKPPLPQHPRAPPPLPSHPLTPSAPPPLHTLSRYDAVAGQLLQGTYVLEATAAEQGAHFYLQVKTETSTPNPLTLTLTL